MAVRGRDRFLPEVVPCVFHQFLAEIRVRDGGHRLRALAQALAGEHGDAVLRRDVLDQTVLPEGIAATMLLLRSPSLVTRETLMQMKPLPPCER